MRGIRVWKVFVVAAFILNLAQLPVAAQMAGMTQIRHTFSLTPWFTSVTATEPGGTGTWRTTMWVLDYHLTSESPWGFHLRYGTGGQSGWGDTFAGATSGSDRLWNIDVSYHIRTREMAQASVRVFAGYGSMQWETTSPGFLAPGLRRVSSSGFRIGANVSMPLQMTAGPGWSLFADLAWSPSNSVRALSGGTETTSSGSATEWAIGISYKFGLRSGSSVLSGGDYVPAVLQRNDFDPSWRGSLGYRQVNFSGNSSYRWSGFFLSLGKTF